MADRKDQQELFDPPIERDLAGNPGAVSFGSRKSLEEWAAAEVAVWRAFPAEKVHGVFRSVAQLQRNTAQELLDCCRAYFSGPNDQRQQQRNQIDARLQRYQRHEVVHHRTALGQLAIQLAEVEPTEAAAAIWGHAQLRRELENRDPRAWISDKNFSAAATLAIQGVMRALVARGVTFDQRTSLQAIEAIRTELEKTNTAWQTLCAKAAAQWETTKVSQTEALSDHLKEAMAKTDAHIAEATDKIQKLEQLFGEKIRLEAPVQYWRNKYTRHDKGVRVWGLAYAAIAICPLAAAVIYAPSIYERFTQLQGSLTTAGLAILLTVAVLYLALGRLVGRLFSLSLSQREDAGERVVMTETFLALVQDNKLSEEDRRLALSALFRPRAAAVDAEGATGIADMLSKAISPGKS